MTFLARAPQWLHLATQRQCAQQPPVAPTICTPSQARQRLTSRPARCRAAAADGGGSGSGSNTNTNPSLPPAGSPPAAVADWAALSFRESARTNLTKSCLLLALEEEAAAAAAYAEAEGLDGASSEPALLRRPVGSASTWSLDRITSLAEEAAVAFYASLQDLGVADAVLGVAREVTDSTLLTLHIDLVRSYPTHLLNAVNQVLYERHGYRRQRKHGDPLDMRLSNVLENGNGSPGSLAVLYLELCARLSLPLQPVALEGGRYFVLQPARESGFSLSAAGESFVVDPYSEGMLLSEAEVRELFEVEGPLQPCSNEAMLAGMLGALRDAHWCAALGCPPEPIWAVPISLEVALGEYRDVEVETSSGEDAAGGYFRITFNEPGQEPEQDTRGGQHWWPAQGYHLQRSLEAARKRSWLLPTDLTVLLEFALLLYFSKQYEEAWQELGCVLQAAKHAAGRDAFSSGQELQSSDGPGVVSGCFSGEDLRRMELLWEKVRLQLTFADS